jgi:hypothetical protein
MDGMDLYDFKLKLLKMFNKAETGCSVYIINVFYEVYCFDFIIWIHTVNSSGIQSYCTAI